MQPFSSHCWSLWKVGFATGWHLKEGWDFPGEKRNWFHPYVPLLGKDTAYSQVNGSDSGLGFMVSFFILASALTSIRQLKRA